MKSFKKLLSLVLAGVLALSLLTACGGSSGGTTPPTTFISSKTAYIIVQISNREKFYWDYSYKDELFGGTAHPIIISNGDSSYIESGSWKAWTDADYTYVPANQYFDTTGKDNVLIKVDWTPYTIISRSYEMNYNPFDFFVSSASITSFETGTVNISGTNYYSETVTSSDSDGSPITLAFCYQNDTWKYLIYSGEEYGEQYEYLMAINRFDDSVDESDLKVPASYTEILTPAEYLAKYSD